MQIGVPYIIPNKNVQKGTLAQKHCTGRPRHPTYYRVAVSSYGWSAMVEQSPQMPPRGEWQQLKNVPLSCWLIKNWLVQARNIERCPRRKLLLTDKSSSKLTTFAQKPTAANERNVRSAIILTEILFKVSSGKWGRSNGMGEGLSAHSVWDQSGLSA